MIRDFLESIKYVGYIYPVAFLRIFIGYIFLQKAYTNYNSDFIVYPKLAAQITDWIPFSQAPDLYITMLESVVVPNWKVFAFIIVYVQFVIGISFLLGFLVRPVSVVAILYTIHSIFSHAQPALELHYLYLALFIFTLLIGGGRCLGFDYFFYKRQRGLFW